MNSKYYQNLIKIFFVFDHYLKQSEKEGFEGRCVQTPYKLCIF